MLRVNNATCRMLEYSRRGIIEPDGHGDHAAKKIWNLRLLFAQAADAHDRARSTVCRWKSGYITKSGETLWTNLNASVLREGTENCSFLGIIENITERKQVEEQLRESQKLESLGVLAGGIAHDFNNLLTGILGNASLSLELVSSDSPIRPLLKRLVQASERAADLTRQLLAYAGKGRFVLRVINLSTLVQEIGGLVRSSFPAHVRLELQLAAEAPTIEADPSQIQQIVMNLLINAAESIPDDQEGVVTLRTFEFAAGEEDLRGTLPSSQPQPGNYAVIEVVDNGSGIDPSTQARMFEPFFTTKFTGRGLGLSAVLGIVSSYKGLVRVESQRGMGTRFQVLLPTSDKGTRAPAVIAPKDLRGTGTVLLVDDEPLVLSLARNALERAGYRVLAAAGGLDAVEILEQNRDDVNLVVLDVTMPDMSGEETLGRLKRIRPDLPVVLSTGHSETETAERFAGTPLAGFLQKPYTASQMAERIKSAMQGEWSR